MARGTNFYKLGLFMLLGGALLVGALMLLALRSWSTVSVPYVSYFDESVQGLEVGAPVKFRGVTVGQVSGIEIAPDRRHVEVRSELELSKLGRLNANADDKAGQTTAPGLTIHPFLRMQLTQTGITGMKFVLIDYVDVSREPPTLPFATPPNYIPAAPSTLENLETSLVETADRFPEMAKELAETLVRLNRIMASLEQSHLPERASATFERLDETLVAVGSRGLLRHVESTLTAFDRSLARADGLFARIDGKDGLVARAERAAGSFADMAKGSDSLGPELNLTLREVRGAARSIRRFADALERDPDMLLKGRAEGGQ